MSRFDVVSFGEALLRLSPAGQGRLAAPGALEKNAAGAELNVAAGCAQLGLSAAFLSRLPQNALGAFLAAQAREHGVSDQLLLWDESPAARLGVYYYEQASAPRKPAVVYDRRHSSFCSLSPEDLPPRAEGRLFHTSGITLALGDGPRRAAAGLMEAFRRQGGLVSFDVNYRAALWGEAEARAAIEPLLPLVDVLFVSEESLRRMFGRTGALEDIQREFAAQYGLRYVFSTRRQALTPTRHQFTSLAYDREAGQAFTEEPYEIDVVDRVGSGDSYTAGALAGLLQGGGARRAMRLGNAMAALKCTVPGDLPRTSLAEAERLMAAHGSSLPQSEMDR